MKFILLYYLYFVCRLVYLHLTYDTATGFYFLNVGQGDASIIKQSNLLGFVDGGPDYSADYFLDNLSPFFNCKIDFVVISHPHKDHIGGFDRILERCKVTYVFYSKQDYNSQIWTRVLKSFESSSIVMEAGDGTNISFNNSGLSFLFLWPPTAKECKISVNDCSLVALAMAGDFEVLYTGDVSSKVSGKLLLPPLNATSGRVDVLKMPHHGGKGTLTSDLLAKIQPKGAVVSYGLDNRYGHPAKESLDLMEVFAIPVSHTSNGLVLVKTYD